MQDKTRHLLEDWLINTSTQTRVVCSSAENLISPSTYSTHRTASKAQQAHHHAEPNIHRRSQKKPMLPNLTTTIHMTHGKKVKIQIKPRTLSDTSQQWSSDYPTKPNHASLPTLSETTLSIISNYVPGDKEKSKADTYPSREGKGKGLWYPVWGCTSSCTYML